MNPWVDSIGADNHDTSRSDSVRTMELNMDDPNHLRAFMFLTDHQSNELLNLLLDTTDSIDSDPYDGHAPADGSIIDIQALSWLSDRVNHEDIDVTASFTYRNASGGVDSVDRVQLISEDHPYGRGDYSDPHVKWVQEVQAVHDNV